MGRRAYLEERKVSEIVSLSYETIKRALSSDELSAQVKAEIASKFLSRAIPQVVDNSATEELIGAVVYTLRGMRKQIDEGNRDTIEV